MYRFLIALCSLCLSQPGLAAPEVAVSIKPLHSLVSALMQDVAQPALVLQSDHDPHHFSLKPSQRSKLARAHLIVWVGPGLESSLVRAIGASRGVSLALIDAGLPELHASRSGDSIDPHVWLSPANAGHIVGKVAEALIRLDADNREQYIHNRDRLLERITALATRLKNEMALPRRSYIAQHDAYQYFEKSFGLDGIGFISNSHDGEPVFSNMRRLARLVAQRSASCIVYLDSERPGIIDTLGSSADIRYARVPVLGTEYEAGPELWFELMTQIAQRFRACLQ